MRRLADFMQRDDLTPNWCRALSEGEVTLFEDTLIVTTLVGSVLVVNSASLSGDNEPFSRGALRHLKHLLDTHERIVISSSNTEIAEHLRKKYGLVYNAVDLFYSRGL